MVDNKRLKIIQIQIKITRKKKTRRKTVETGLKGETKPEGSKNHRRVVKSRNTNRTLKAIGQTIEVNHDS